MGYVVKKDEAMFNVLSMLMKTVELGKAQDKIPVFLIPTVYGTGALVHRSAEGFLIHEKDSALCIDIRGSAMIYGSDKTENAHWLLFVNKGVLHRDQIARKYILPIDMDVIEEDGAIKTIFFTEDELRRGNAYNIYYEADLVLPQA